MKSQTLRSLSPRPVAGYCRTIVAWQGRLTKAAHDPDRELFWQLSSLVTLAYRWKLDPSAKNVVRDTLMPNFSLPDDRLIANTIDALLVLMVSEPEPIVARLTPSSNNRVRANALVKKGFTKLDVKGLRQLERLIASRDPYQVASGLYALAEIAGHYLDLDAVYFEANLKAQRLITRALDHLASDDEMVRRQAERLHVKSARARPAA